MLSNIHSITYDETVALSVSKNQETVKSNVGAQIVFFQDTLRLDDNSVFYILHRKRIMYIEL